MSDIQFGATAELLKSAIDGAGMAHSTIVNNVANVNTPNYRRSDVSFKEALAATQAEPAPPSDELAMVITSEKHLGGTEAPSPVPFHAAPVIDESTQMRIDKSNVDVDQEMAKLSQNSSYAQTMAQLLQTQYMRTREAISERA